MRLLIERTIDTGQERLAPLSEVEPDILAQLWPLVQEAIKSGQRIHVGAGWCAGSLRIRGDWKRSCSPGRRARPWYR